MTNIKHLSSTQILSNLQRLVSNEREILSDILEHLRELEIRKTFLEMGYSSLFDFLVKFLNYSPDQAYRRLSAARLTLVLPQAKSKLQSGELTLANATTLYQFLRAEKKVAPQKVGELLHAACVESKERLQQKLISSTSRVEVQKRMLEEKVRPVTEQLSTVQMTLKQSTVEKLRRLRDLKSNQLQDKTQLSDLIELLVDEELARQQKKWGAVGIEPVRGGQRATLPGKVMEDKSASTAAEIAPDAKCTELSENPEPVAAPSRYIARAVRAQVLARDQQRCQYRYKHLRCSATRYLQFDHRIPLVKQGRSTTQNLQLLCSNHNRWKGAR